MKKQADAQVLAERQKSLEERSAFKSEKTNNEKDNYDHDHGCLLQLRPAKYENARSTFRLTVLYLQWRTLKAATHWA